MTLTEKERSLLCDLKSCEELCIKKYEKYSTLAHDTELKNLFTTLSGNEKKHLSTLNDILSGVEVTMSTSAPKSTDAKMSFTPSTVSETEKNEDGFLCKDALSMEKHVSGVYDTSVFEFSSPALRDTLSHIQKEEQNHGQMLYSYLSTNGLYN